MLLSVMFSLIVSQLDVRPLVSGCITWMETQAGSSFYTGTKKATH